MALQEDTPKLQEENHNFGRMQDHLLDKYWIA